MNTKAEFHTGRVTLKVKKKRLCKGDNIDRCMINIEQEKEHQFQKRPRGDTFKNLEVVQNIWIRQL